MNLGIFIMGSMLFFAVWKKIARREWAQGAGDYMKTNILAMFIIILAVTGSAFAVGMLPDTGQTDIYATGDDGYYQSASPMSFTDTGNGTIIDNRTGLIWIKEPPVLSYAWDAAISACENLVYGNASDWRLPNINELMSIVDYQSAFGLIAPFVSLSPACYWSSTSALPGTSYGSSAALLSCHPIGGWLAVQSKSSSGGKSGTRIRCVRGGL